MNQIKKKLSDNKGFSLIELIIVLAILAILVGVLAPNLFKYIEKARESKRLSEADALRRCYETAVVDLASQGISPANGGFLNIVKGELKPASDLGNASYNQGIKDAFDTTFTDDYERLYYISLQYSPLGELEALYMNFAEGNTLYNYAYSPLQPETLLNNGYKLIEGSEWYRGPKQNKP